MVTHSPQGALQLPGTVKSSSVPSGFILTQSVLRISKVLSLEMFSAGKNISPNIKNRNESIIKIPKMVFYDFHALILLLIHGTHLIKKISKIFFAYPCLSSYDNCIIRFSFAQEQRKFFRIFSKVKLYIICTGVINKSP